MINIENLTDFEPNLESLRKIAQTLTTQDVDLTLCYNETIQAYNKEYRQQNNATDVLSFPINNDIILTESNIFPLGSIVISVDYVKEKAEIYQHSDQDELSLLFIHGMLHLLAEKIRMANT